MVHATNDSAEPTAAGNAAHDQAGSSTRLLSARIKPDARLGATLIGGFIDALFPPVCLACRTPVADADALCTQCWCQIDFIRQPLCDRLGIPLPYDTRPFQAGPATSAGHPAALPPMVSAAAVANPPAYDRARAVAAYGPALQRLIHALKYHDRHDGRRLFGRWMRHAGAELLADADVIVPIPLHRWRLMSRTFNQSAILAGEIARLSGVTYAPLALLRTKPTPSQVGLTGEERRRNVGGAFKVAAIHRHRIAGKRVLLIDDVITTGATCSAAAIALRRANAARVDVLALAIATHTVT